MRLFIILTLIFFTAEAKGQTSNENILRRALGEGYGSETSPNAAAYGVTFSAALGQTNLSITPPGISDDANYSGISLRAEANLPFYQAGGFQSEVSLFGTYYDLENNSNNSSQRENANHIGPGIGLHLRFFRLFAGADLQYIRARHYWVGDFTNEFAEFDYQKFSYTIGLDFTLAEELKIGFSYETHDSTISSDELYSTGDSALVGNTVWMYFQYSTGKSVVGFFNSVFE